MFDNFPSEIIVIPVLFIALPWLILHYVTKWKTASTLTNDDEALLDDLYQLARRLDDRMDTVERLVAADNPDFREARQLTDGSAKAASLDDLSAAPTKLRSGR
jgi:phage shock protein B